ncbi:MAG: hypothetical protein AB4050_18270 [Synechococcus sp.]
MGNTPQKQQPQSSPAANPEDYTNGMRIAGGMIWGTVLSLTVGSGMVLLPQVPRPWLWGVPVLWVSLSALGIWLQWSVARGKCPKCGHEQSVTRLGKRCPQCRTFLQASNRKIVRI